ncbi:MAG: hypothetical protein AMXMBFR47_39710 [Planctomycetota bacterium]
MNTRRWIRWLSAAAIGFLGGVSAVQADVIIIGGLGNFDTPNNTGDDCNEFDIELEGPHCDDVYHTYRNYNYGSPTIEPLPGNVGIRVVYRNPQHATHAGAIEHFGVSLRGGVQITARRFQWIPGTVGVPNPPPPPPPPPPLPLPVITSEVLFTPTGIVLRETVENVDEFGRSIWIRRSETTVDREVALEELMPDDPLIGGTTPVDIEFERLHPGELMIEDEDADSLAELSSHVMVYEVFSDAAGAPGQLINTMLMASVTQTTACPEPYMPYFTAHPVDAWAPPGDGLVTFTAAAAGPDPEAYGTLEYQWRHEGVDMVGEDREFVEIDTVNAETAGAYTCVVRNGCGMVVGNTAYLRIGQPPCTGDINGDGEVDLRDLATLLSNFGTPYGATPVDGDTDDDHDVDLSDLATLLSNFGSNCP